MNRCIVLGQVQGKEGGYSQTLLLKRRAALMDMRGINQNEIIMCISRVNDRKLIHISQPERRSRVEKWGYVKSHLLKAPITSKESIWSNRNESIKCICRESIQNLIRISKTHRRNHVKEIRYLKCWIDKRNQINLWNDQGGQDPGPPQHGTQAVGGHTGLH